jgi:hypothetical protein
MNAGGAGEMKSGNEQIELWRSQFPRRCRQSACRARATVIVRHVDEQGKSLRQAEFCERHAIENTKNRIVRDMR